MKYLLDFTYNKFSMYYTFIIWDSDTNQVSLDYSYDIFSSSVPDYISSAVKCMKEDGYKYYYKKVPLERFFIKELYTINNLIVDDKYRLELYSTKDYVVTLDLYSTLYLAGSHMVYLDVPIRGSVYYKMLSWVITLHFDEKYPSDIFIYNKLSSSNEDFLFLNKKAGIVFLSDMFAFYLIRCKFNNDIDSIVNIINSFK